MASQIPGMSEQGKGTTQLDEGRVVMGGTSASGSSTYTSDTSAGMVSGGGAQIVGGDEARGFHDGPGPQVLAASSFEGEDVVNANGENLGDIKDIMLDVESGRIAYAVLSVGGVMGMGEKLFAIPWSAFKIDADNKQLILNVDKDKLSNAPGFDKDNWPHMADMQWASGIHSYYGEQPYWK